MFTKRLITRLVFTTLIVASLFFSELGTTPVYAADMTINTNADELFANTSCSLREAITNANNNAATYPECGSGFDTDTITFAGNYTITLAGGQLPAVTSTIIINGNGAANTIIQANANPNTATYRVFMVSGGAGNLTLNGLTVRHGRCNGGCAGQGPFGSLNFYGGGILVNGGTLTVTNSTFSANTASAGGGISNNQGTLAVVNSTFSGNSANETGGGIYSNYGTLTVTNSTFSGNRAFNIGGGIGQSRSTLTISDSSFSGNSAGYGGGIYTYIVTVAITNSSLSGNSAVHYGGGIYNDAEGTLNLTNSTLSGNSAGPGGGGIYNSSVSDLGIYTSTLSGNNAAMGGGIYNAGNLWLGNATLSGNEAYDYGGGIYTDGSAWIHNSTIVFNTLVEGTNLGAGGIDGNVSLYNSIVAGNTRALSSEYRDCSGTMYLVGVNAFWDTTNCSTHPASPGYSTSFYSLNELGPLQDNGGPTWTHALIAIEEGSRVIDAGDNTVCAASPVNNLDQRGVTRPQGSRCDIGAYEYQESTTATFGDVPTSHWAWMFVERLSNAGITGGCGNGNYCPDGSVTRAQMAIFLLRGIHGSSYTPPAVGGSTGFGDVSTTHWAAAWIKQLAAEGITGGCGSGNYCPEASVTRAQMSIFLLRSKYSSSYNPPAAGGSTGFGDVAPNFWAAAWIKQLVAEGITAGCGNGNYCPESAVTRAQMAVFLVRTFNLP